MPFRVQCPHAECRKFMLLEDSTRGTTVSCLVCGQPIRVDASVSDSKLAPPGAGAEATGTRPTGPTSRNPEPRPPDPKPQESGATRVVNCPECRTALKLPATSAGQSIRCPKCKHVFKP